jgi:hypothetical protein
MKLILMGVLAAIYIGVVYFARFLVSLLVIVFCGFGIYEIVRNFTQSAAKRRATA